jgi:hypothetical protein
MDNLYGILFGKMKRHSLFRVIFVAVAVLLAGSMTAAAVEHGDGYHTKDIHHCSVCHANHHTAAPVQRQTTQLIPQEQRATTFDLVLLYDQAVLDLIVPPPKSLS